MINSLNAIILNIKRFGEKNLSYFAVDMLRLMAHKPQAGANLFAGVMALFQAKRIAPPRHAAFPITGLPAALTHSAKDHVGNVIINMTGTVPAQAPASLRIDPNKVQIITGGASGGQKQTYFYINKSCILGRYPVFVNRYYGSRWEQRCTEPE